MRLQVYYLMNIHDAGLQNDKKKIIGRYTFWRSITQINPYVDKHIFYYANEDNMMCNIDLWLFFCLTLKNQCHLGRGVRDGYSENESNESALVHIIYYFIIVKSPNSLISAIGIRFFFSQLRYL